VAGLSKNMNNNKKNILVKLSSIEEQLSRLSERLYQPQLSPSDQRELQKRKKKLDRDKVKLSKKLNEHT
jgi:hypothetical protein